MRGSLCALLLVTLSYSWAQDKFRGPGPYGRQRPAAALRGPALGLVYDPPSGSVRPLVGLPGAATLGPALASPPLDRAVSASGQLFALGVSRADGSVVEVTAGAVRKFPGLTASPEEIVLSPSAAAAAFYHRDRGLIEVIDRLPGTAAPVVSYDVRGVPGRVTALAVSDDGTVLAGVETAAGVASAYVFAKGSGPKPVLSLEHAASVAFIGSTGDALVADDAASVVYRIRDAAGSAAAAAIAGAAEGVARPAAVGASADGKLAIVANDGAPVLLVNLQSRAAAQVACECRATGVERMAGNAVFRLTADAEPQIWMLDADAPQPRTVFVPRQPAHPVAK